MRGQTIEHRRIWSKPLKKHLRFMVVRLRRRRRFSWADLLAAAERAGA